MAIVFCTAAPQHSGMVRPQLTDYRCAIHSGHRRGQISEFACGIEALPGYRELRHRGDLWPGDLPTPPSLLNGRFGSFASPHVRRMAGRVWKRTSTRRVMLCQNWRPSCVTGSPGVNKTSVIRHSLRLPRPAPWRQPVVLRPAALLAQDCDPEIAWPLAGDCPLGQGPVKRVEQLVKWGRRDPGLSGQPLVLLDVPHVLAPPAAPRAWW
jgi:hypothetical protein